GGGYPQGSALHDSEADFRRPRASGRKARLAPRLRRGELHRRSTHAMAEIRALIRSIVVIGRKNLNPGRSMTMSPGSRKSGSRLTHDHPRPRRMRLTPRVTSGRFIAAQ